MSFFTATVEMNNAAFVDDGEHGRLELHRILIVAAAQAVASGDGDAEGILRDINGNTVGAWVIKADRDE